MTCIFPLPMIDATTTSPACTTCGIRPGTATSHGFDALCKECNEARVQELYRITEHYEQHPTECCCNTFLGRHSCMALAHGERWRVKAISDGQRFCYVIRAKDRAEAMEVGSEMCEDNGEECIGVTKIHADPCLTCRAECGNAYWRLKGVRGHFCSEGCCCGYRVQA